MLMFTPLRLIASLLGLLVIGVPLAAFVIVLLAVLGSPGSCESPDRPIVARPEDAAAFQAKWDALNAALDGGRESTFTFTEGEATARAQQWVEENDVPVTDLRVCFDEGAGSASGKVDVPFFPGDVDVLVRGTVNLTGTKPNAVIDEIEVGSLPGPSANLVEQFINAIIDEQEKDVALAHDYGLAFEAGQMIVTGQP